MKAKCVKWASFLFLEEAQSWRVRVGGWLWARSSLPGRQRAGAASVSYAPDPLPVAQGLADLARIDLKPFNHRLTKIIRTKLVRMKVEAEFFFIFLLCVP